MRLTIILLLTLVATGIVFSACTSNAQQSPDPNGNPAAQAAPGNYRGGFNITPEQRQQMLQQITAACDGKSENDTCILETPMGNRTGLCQTQNSTLRCRTTRQRPPQQG